MSLNNPNYAELDQMKEFCEGHKYVFIYRTEPVQKLISKYLYMSGIGIEGFIKPEVYERDRANEPFPIYNFPELCRFAEAKGRESIGVIISLDNSVCDQIVDTLKVACGIEDIFLVSRLNRETIPEKMQPHKEEDFYLEVNLADHCNLNCQCCDHFSPLAKETYYDYEQYEKDIKRLARLTGGRLGMLRFEGGEPLLNDRLIDYLKVTRELFSDTRLCIITNGLLLRKWGDYDGEENIWEAIKRYEVEIWLTEYPINLDLGKIKQDAMRYNVPVQEARSLDRHTAVLWIWTEFGKAEHQKVKKSIRQPLDLFGKQKRHIFISCHQFNRCIVLRDGRIYTCPIIPYAHYFNEFFGENLEIKDDCYIDIYKAASFGEIAEFCTHRTSFCDYCALENRYAIPWKQSEKDIKEWSL